MPFLPTLLALVLVAAVAGASGGLFLALLSGLNRLETAVVRPSPECPLRPAGSAGTGRPDPYLAPAQEQPGGHGGAGALTGAHAEIQQRFEPQPGQYQRMG